MKRWVLVTRAADELAELAASLAHRGVHVHPYPVLAPRPVDDVLGWEEVRSHEEAFEWLVLTSPRAAAEAVPAAARHGLDALLRRLPVAAVGERTAARATGAGLRVALVGSGGGELLAARLAPHLAPGNRVLHPCGRDRRPELGRHLSSLGVQVMVVEVYAMEEVPREQLPRLPEGEPVAVLLTSPRSAAAYLAALGGTPLPCPHLAMGATTVTEARRLGLSARPLAAPSLAAFEEELLCRILS